MTYRNAEVVRHDTPYKPIDLRGRRRVITLTDLAESGMREPDPASYSYDPIYEAWVLKE